MILTSNRSTACKIIYEFVIPKFKKQHTNLLFILHLNFNKLEVSLLLALISTTNSPLEKKFTLKNVIVYLKQLGTIFCQMPVIVTIEALDLCKV
jgi:hypothetical protein